MALPGRVPFAPLEGYLRRRWGCNTPPGEPWEDGDWSDQVGANQLGVNRAVVVKWRQRGMSIDQAETAAAAMCAHPIEIWGRAAYVLLWVGDELSRTRECSACGRLFVAVDSRAARHLCSEPECTDVQSRCRGNRRLRSARTPLPSLA